MLSQRLMVYLQEFNNTTSQIINFVQFLWGGVGGWSAEQRSVLQRLKCIHGRGEKVCSLWTVVMKQDCFGESGINADFVNCEIAKHE